MTRRATARRRISNWPTLARTAAAGLVAVCLVFGGLSLGPAAATPSTDLGREKRVALVIGNGAYKALPELANPAHDAQDIAAALRDVGFEVVLGTDLDRAGLDATVEQFAQKASDADTALFYYAGHGFQLESQNHIAAVDAHLASLDDIERYTVKIDSILARLDRVKGTRIVFLDACRNNPLPKSMRAALANSGDGLSEISGSAGLFIGFATQPGNVAFDGSGGRNSFFSRAVLSHIATRGQDIAAMMIDVRKDVIAATGGAQIPWDNSSITTPFRFVPGPADQASPELRLWQVAANGRDTDLLRLYVDRYPEGAHAADALAALQSAPAPESSTARSAVPTVASDDSLWENARSTRWRPLVEHYLKRFPAGRHASEATALLELLPEAGSAKETPEAACERLATHPRDATAAVAGVPLERLRDNAALAVDRCRVASEAHPEQPHFEALLARALAAAGSMPEAVETYRKAAGQGDIRAMVSLGLLMEEGTAVPKDAAGAIALYEQAAAKGSADGAVNLAVALLRGVGVPRDPKRALGLLETASAGGSAQATLNLGVLADRGMTRKDSAFAYFKKAAELGEPRAYVRAAILLDEGRGVGKNPDAAADMVLTGVAADYGEAAQEIATNGAKWSAPTRKSLQTKLKAAGYFDGAIDAKVGPKLVAALRDWRSKGGIDLSAAN